MTRPREPAPACRELRKTHAKCSRAWCLAVRAPALIWRGVFTQQEARGAFLRCLGELPNDFFACSPPPVGAAHWFVVVSKLHVKVPNAYNIQYTPNFARLGGQNMGQKAILVRCERLRTPAARSRVTPQNRRARRCRLVFEEGPRSAGDRGGR